MADRRGQREAQGTSLPSRIVDVAAVGRPCALPRPDSGSYLPGSAGAQHGPRHPKQATGQAPQHTVLFGPSRSSVRRAQGRSHRGVCGGRNDAHCPKLSAPLRSPPTTRSREFKQSPPLPPICRPSPGSILLSSATMNTNGMCLLKRGASGATAALFSMQTSDSSRAAQFEKVEQRRIGMQRLVTFGHLDCM